MLHVGLDVGPGHIGCEGLNPYILPRLLAGPYCEELQYDVVYQRGAVN